MKQIDIKQLIPFMKDGWVAMDENKSWIWFNKQPRLVDGSDIWLTSVQGGGFSSLDAFNIKPVKNWRNSLIRIDESQNNLCTTDDTPHLESTVLFLDLLENKDE